MNKTIIALLGVTAAKNLPDLNQEWENQAMVDTAELAELNSLDFEDEDMTEMRYMSVDQRLAQQDAKI